MPTRATKVVLAVPDLSLRTGGIATVGHSILRLLARRQQKGRIDYRLRAIRGCDDRKEQRLLEHLAADRVRHFSGSVPRFSASLLPLLATWADAAIFTHVGVASVLSLLPERLTPASLTFLMGQEMWRRLRLREKRGLSKTRALVSITEFTSTKAREFNPWLPPVAVCHLGVPRQTDGERADNPRALHFEPTTRDILFVGRMVTGEVGKGQEDLILAMESVTREVPDARLLLVGTGSAVPALRERARATRAADRIFFTGYLSPPALGDLYRSCGVFAMPSRQDGFGLVYLEAMRAGLPCICSDADGGQEVVSDGVTGYHVPASDPRTLAGRLVALLKDDDLRRKMGSAGRTRFEELFTEEHFHRRLEALLEPCLAGPNT